MTDRTQWLDADEMDAWRSFVDASTAVMAGVEADLEAAHDLRVGEYGVLVSLSEQPDDRMRMCDLAAVLHLSPSGLTRRIDAMVKRGLVDRTPSADDRRVMLAGLTAKGRSTLELAAPGHVASVRARFIDHLSRAQLMELANSLGAVARADVGSLDEPRAS